MVWIHYAAQNNVGSSATVLPVSDGRLQHNATQHVKNKGNTLSLCLQHNQYELIHQKALPIVQTASKADHTMYLLRIISITPVWASGAIVIMWELVLTSWQCLIFQCKRYFWIQIISKSNPLFLVPRSTPPKVSRKFTHRNRRNNDQNATKT